MTMILTNGFKEIYSQGFHKKNGSRTNENLCMNAHHPNDEYLDLVDDIDAVIERKLRSEVYA